jgi:hypothetical protein
MKIRQLIPQNMAWKVCWPLVGPVIEHTEVRRGHRLPVTTREEQIPPDVVICKVLEGIDKGTGTFLALGLIRRKRLAAHVVTPSTPGSVARARRLVLQRCGCHRSFPRHLTRLTNHQSQISEALLCSEQ